MRTSGSLPEECREEIRANRMEGSFDADRPKLICPRHHTPITESKTGYWSCYASLCEFSTGEIERMIGHCLSHDFEATDDETEVVCLKCGKKWVLNDKEG